MQQREQYQQRKKLVDSTVMNILYEYLNVLCLKCVKFMRISVRPRVSSQHFDYILYLLNFTLKSVRSISILREPVQ